MKINRIRQVILDKRISIILITGSFLYGLQLFRHPEILENYELYSVIREIFHGEQIGSMFILLAILKAIGVILNSPIIKLIARTGLMFVWTLFLVAFTITPPPNTIWVLACVMIMLTSVSTLSDK